MLLIRIKSLLISNYYKKFPKISYTNIYDISYVKSNKIFKRKRISMKILNNINTAFNNYNNYVYAMHSFPLAYNFHINQTKYL